MTKPTGVSATFTPAQRSVTLALLTITYFFSYMDRQIMSILLEPVKGEFLLSDTQMGLLGGLAFAVFYATLGIPVATLSDRLNRRNIITAALTIWSAFTVACGFAQNFVQLLLARIGVGIGEAGSSPPSHSLIADLYPPEKRAGALAIYSLGVSIGAACGTIIGGTVAHYYGWRTAFIAVGLPGLLLAIFVRLFVTEPRRGASEPDQHLHSQDGPSDEATGFFAMLSKIGLGFGSIATNRAALHLTAGFTLTSTIGYGLSYWGPAYYTRSFDFTLLDISTKIAPILALAGIVGVVGGGTLANWCARRWGLWSQATMIAVLKTIALPFAMLLYLTDVAWLGLAAYFVSLVFASCYLGPTFSLIQTLAPIKMRSLWAAITLFINNLIGLGIGPLAIGALSDLLEPYYGEESLRWALLIGLMVTPWAIFHYWRAGVALKRQGFVKAPEGIAAH